MIDFPHLCATSQESLSSIPWYPVPCNPLHHLFSLFYGCFRKENKSNSLHPSCSEVKVRHVYTSLGLCLPYTLYQFMYLKHFISHNFFSVWIKWELLVFRMSLEWPIFFMAQYIKINLWIIHLIHIYLTSLLCHMLLLVLEKSRKKIKWNLQLN